MTGIAVGEALVMPRDVEHHIHRRQVAPDEAAREDEKCRAALAKAAEEIDREIEQLRGYGNDASEIFEFHKALILSPDLAQAIRTHILDGHMSAEYALFTAMRRWHEHFNGLNSQTAAQKVHDLVDVERRIMRHLVGGAMLGFGSLGREVVLVAHTLTPSQAASLRKTKIKGFATDIGGQTAHTAIMARAMAVPAVVGTGDLSLRIRGGQTVIIDGLKGLVIVDPDSATLEGYREQERRHRAAFDALVAERDLPAETIDGYQVEVLANIELPEEVEMALAMGARGVGLYRTEYLYEECHEPSEDMQYNVYHEVARSLGGRPCIIRTMDLGADKFAHEGQQDGERNPFLGSRSIRYSLQRPELFMVQLRAILRASVAGDVRILFPMISVVEELREAKRLLARAKEELAAGGIPFRPHIPVGIMVEVPSAALTVGQLAGGSTSSASGPTTWSSTPSRSTASTSAWRTCTSRDRPPSCISSGTSSRWRRSSPKACACAARCRRTRVSCSCSSASACGNTAWRLSRRRWSSTSCGPYPWRKPRRSPKRRAPWTPRRNARPSCPSASRRWCRT